MTVVLNQCLNPPTSANNNENIKACSAPSHYLNQCSLIVNWTPRNKLQWNLNQNPIIFIQENAFENVVCQNGGHFVQGGDELIFYCCLPLIVVFFIHHSEWWPDICRYFLPLCCQILWCQCHYWSLELASHPWFIAVQGPISLWCKMSKLYNVIIHQTFYTL